MNNFKNNIPALCIAVLFVCQGFYRAPAVLAQAPPPDNGTKEKVQDMVREDTDSTGGKKSADKQEKAGQKIFGFDIGYNGSYANGTAPDSFYSQPFVNLYLKHKYVKFTAGLSRFWDYQITNGAGKYENVNFTQPKIALSIYPHEVIELYGSYKYSTGDASHYYKVHDGSVGLNLDFNVVTLGVSFEKKISEYIFKSDDIESFYDIYTSNRRFLPPRMSLFTSYRSFKKRNTQHTSDISVNPAFSVFVHDTTSIDLSYDYQKGLFEYIVIGNQTKQDEFITHTGKLGITSDPWKYVSFFADVSIGKDSQGYLIAGGDIGPAFTVADYISISGTYSPAYNIAPPVQVLGVEVSETFLKYREIVAIRSLFRRNNANPYLRLSNIGKSFWTHGVSFGVLFKY